MRSSNLLLRAKLTPPRLHRRALARPRVLERLSLAFDHRLTVVQAGTGYGKTTALAELFNGDGQRTAGTPPAGGQPSASPPRLFWYTLDESDRDPQQFLSYLIGAFSLALPGLSPLATPWAVLNELGAAGPGGQWFPAVDALTNALAEVLGAGTPSLLVLDDYHIVGGAPELEALAERFIAYAPADLHVILATRHPVILPAMATWRARGEMLEIGRQELAFQLDEVRALLSDVYGVELTQEQAADLFDLTEGWPIALQLAGQSLLGGAKDGISAFLKQGSTSSSALFDYLARELLDRQPPEIARFLVETAVLRDLTPAACDAVRDASSPGTVPDPAGLSGTPETLSSDSAAILARLHGFDLFIVGLGDGHSRHHHLFRDFLLSRAEADPVAVRARHRRAAAHFEAGGNPDEAIYHWLAAGAFDEAAAEIENAGETALRSGRVGAVAGWIDALPAGVLAERPRLQAILGDVCRLCSRFDEALGWYGQAERIWRARGDATGISRALHGQAAVYLDTVRPLEADNLLVEALRVAEGITDRATRARLLELMAENKLNTGKPAEAEALRVEARALRDEGPTEDALTLRVKLRTGRHSEARRVMEARVEAERRAAHSGQVHPPRAHRETVLLLSLIEAFQGRAPAAFALAQEGIDLGERLGSPFIAAVGHMRLGHAWQLRGDVPAFKARDEAIRCYETAIALGDRLDVRRTRAEAMWGLTRAYGFHAPKGTKDGAAGGDLSAAECCAAEGDEIARWAGDAWVASLIGLALGASHVLAGQEQKGLDVFARVLVSFRDCGDTFGRAATRLWQSLAHHRLRQAPEEHIPGALEEMLALCETNGYDYLLTSGTLLGPPDPRSMVPLLLGARARRIRPAYVARLLALAGLPEIQVHPGYRLRVETLGTFQVWRGETEIAPREWQRDKARQLFQLLLTEHHRWLQRDEIVDRLWPDLGPEAATRDFKVALNALNRAVEPGHLQDEPFAFVVREGTSYRLRPEADLWHDAAEFERHCEAGLRGGLTGSGSEETLAHLRAAMQLYKGDYLPEALYEDWSAEARERLLTCYLRAADRLAAALIEQGHPDEALSTCQAILARDPCWERAYRLEMLAHLRMGNRPQALRTFQRCVDALREHLEVAPSPETVSLRDEIAR